MDDGLIMPEARLIGVKGLLSDLEFKILADTIYIGRVSGNDIVLNDTSVSSQHAKITYENGNFIISDLDSKNGISVNGKMITKKVLKNGDKVNVGGTTFRFIFKFDAKSKKTSADSGGSAGTNPVRIAIYALGVMIFLVLLLKLISPEAVKPKVMDSEKEVKKYLDVNTVAVQIPSLTSADRKNPIKASEKHYHNGIIFQDSGDYKKALIEFLIARQLRPGEERFQHALENVIILLNKEIDKHLRLGKMYTNQLRYRDAIKELDYALFLIENRDAPEYSRIQSDIDEIKKRMELQKNQF